jgi:hypothetical protein
MEPDETEVNCIEGQATKLQNVLVKASKVLAQYLPIYVA